MLYNLTQSEGQEFEGRASVTVVQVLLSGLYPMTEIGGSELG